MMLVAEPTIRLIFQQGRFGVTDTAHTARLLQVLLICVFCWGYQQVLSRAFYARLDTLTPAVLGTVMTLLMIPVFYFLSVRIGALGVACASAASIFFYSAALTFWWRVRFGGAVFSGLPSRYGQSSHPVRDLDSAGLGRRKGKSVRPAIFALPGRLF